MTDQELIAKFEDGSLPATAFHHADHVRTAFAYLQRYPGLDALQRFSTGLKQFAKAPAGSPGARAEASALRFTVKQLAAAGVAVARRLGL